MIQQLLNWSPVSPQPRPRGPKPTPVHPDQILDAAQSVFSRLGVRGASLRAIAREAGCDPALIYYHFEHKEALFEALLDRHFPAMHQALDALAKPSDLRPTALRIWEVLTIYQQRLAGAPGLRSMVRGEIVQGAAGLQNLIEKRIRPILMAVRQILTQGIARGELRGDLDPTLATFFLLRMQLEILDWLPVVLPRLESVTPEEAMRRGMQAWFTLYWRGIAMAPLAPVPPLPDPTR